MNVVIIEKLTELSRDYTYKMVVSAPKEALDTYQSLNDTAYKFGNVYYIPIELSKLIKYKEKK